MSDSGWSATASFRTAAAAPPTPAPRAPITIRDERFNTVDWIMSIEQRGGSGSEVSQRMDGGNPGAFRFLRDTIPAEGALFARHQYIARQYNPATEGAIDSIDYSEDRVMFGRPFPQATVHSYFLLVQNGIVYTVPIVSGLGEFNNTDWQTAARTGLRASDFARADGGGGNPDFGSTGAPIVFGYVRGNDPETFDDFVWDHGIDNWTVTIRRVQP